MGLWWSLLSFLPSLSLEGEKFIFKSFTSTHNSSMVFCMLAIIWHKSLFSLGSPDVLCRTCAWLSMRCLSDRITYSVIETVWSGLFYCLAKERYSEIEKRRVRFFLYFFVINLYDIIICAIAFRTERSAAPSTTGHGKTKDHVTANPKRNSSE